MPVKAKALEALNFRAVKKFFHSIKYLGLHLRIGSSVGSEELERNQTQAPKVPQESDKHLHGVKTTGIGGERGISVTLGIKKPSPPEGQLGMCSKGRT